MARKHLTQKAILGVWLRAGGRCEYPGCNTPLWKDELTIRRMNRAYLAHIIARTPDGPRGDPVLSELLATDPTNIMLLCDTHHRLIDREEVEAHPVELLREYKREHEVRIERLTGLQRDRRTHIFLMGTQIGDRQGVVNYKQACEAILPNRYPADDKGIRLDLSRALLNEDDPEFWGATQKLIKRGLSWYLGNVAAPNGEPLNHLSVFALAPVPILVYFGKQLGDIVSADIYQRHRGTNDWKWRKPTDNSFDYIVTRPCESTAFSTQVAVNLSLSGFIHTSEIYAAVGGKIPIYSIAVNEPSRAFLQSKEQLERFQTEWYELLAEIRKTHGENCEIHLFPAVPNSIAIEIGRSLLPKVDPLIVIYDHDKQRDGFYRTITV